MKNSKRQIAISTAVKHELGGASSTSGRARTTVFFPESVDVNLDVAALQQGRPKGELIREAVVIYLRDYLKMDPNQRPNINWSY